MYYSFNKYLRQTFGEKVHRLSLNARLTCPNKDGTLGSDGCIFCNELGYTVFGGNAPGLREQIETSMAVLKKSRKAGKFIAYFQSAAATNADPEKLRSIYDVIRDYDEIAGLWISTRPDCVDDEKLDLIAGYADKYEVWIEYGLQTIHDGSLRFLNRRHTFSQCAEAIERTAQKGIKVGAHVILGLPGESEEDSLATAGWISRMPVSGVKLHVLHVLKGTKLADLYRKGEIELLTRDQYVARVCDFIENLRPDCVILRLVSDARKDFLLAPKWMQHKLAVINMVEDEFNSRGTCQGSAN